MPVELLSYSPAYCLVGAYRFMTDRSLWHPLWLKSRSTLKWVGLAAIPFSLISYPLTRLYVGLILSRSPFSPSRIKDAAYLGISIAQFTTFTLILSQLSAVLEYALRRQLGKAKLDVYDATVRSRGKNADFWIPYVEEWKVPPIERAKRNAEKQSFYAQLAGPIVRMIVLRIILLPLGFIPFLGLVVSAALKSLTLGRILHKPYFAAKKMTPLEIELFMVERQIEYRMFGFTSAILERLPIVGLFFSISNRIGAAMYSFDLEKRQHLYASGQLLPTEVYLSKTAQIPVSDLPEEFVGGFPKSKVDIHGVLIEKSATSSAGDDGAGPRKRAGVVPSKSQ